MTSEAVAQANLRDPLAEGFPGNGHGRALFWIAMAFSSFQILTTAHLLDRPSQIVRAIPVRQSC